MISLYDAQITDILPEYLKKSDEVKALSYAVGRAMQRAIDHSENISVYASIDTLPEDILDLLALELNTQYYDDSFNIRLKRDLIKNTLKWYQTTGTPAAVEETVKAVFGNGTIEEWFEYGGEPYHFKVNTSTMDTTDDMIQQITKAISSVQNVRSYLEEVTVNVMQQMPIYFGSITKAVADSVTLGIDMETNLNKDASESYSLKSDTGAKWLILIASGKITVQEVTDEEPLNVDLPDLMDTRTNLIYRLSITENKLQMVKISNAMDPKLSALIKDQMNGKIGSLCVIDGKLNLI